MFSHLLILLIPDISIIQSDFRVTYLWGKMSVHNSEMSVTLLNVGAVIKYVPITP